MLAFGRVFFFWIDANHQANETARWAAIDHNPYAPVNANPPGTGGRTLQLHVDRLGHARVQRRQDEHPLREQPDRRKGNTSRSRCQKPVYTLTRLLPFSKITVTGFDIDARDRALPGPHGPLAYADESERRDLHVNRLLKRRARSDHGALRDPDPCSLLVLTALDRRHGHLVHAQAPAPESRRRRRARSRVSSRTTGPLARRRSNEARGGDTGSTRRAAVRRRSGAGAGTTLAVHRRRNYRPEPRSTSRSTSNSPGRPRRPRHELERPRRGRARAVRRPDDADVLAAGLSRDTRSLGRRRRPRARPALPVRDVRRRPLPERGACAGRDEDRSGGKGIPPTRHPDQIIAQAEIRYYRYCEGEAPVQIGQPITLNPLADGSTGNGDYQPATAGVVWGKTIGDQKNGDPTGVHAHAPRGEDLRRQLHPDQGRGPGRGGGKERDRHRRGRLQRAERLHAPRAAAVRRLLEPAVGDQARQGEPEDGAVVPRGRTDHELRGLRSGRVFCEVHVTDPPTTSCSFTASVKVNWNDYGNTPPADRICTISVGGTTKQSPGCANGVFNFSASDSVFGRSDLTVSWNCTDQNPKFPGNPSKRIQCPGVAGTQPLRSAPSSSATEPTPASSRSCEPQGPAGPTAAGPARRSTGIPRRRADAGHHDLSDRRSRERALRGPASCAARAHCKNNTNATTATSIRRAPATASRSTASRAAGQADRDTTSACSRTAAARGTTATLSRTPVGGRARVRCPTTSQIPRPALPRTARTRHGTASSRHQASARTSSRTGSPRRSETAPGHIKTQLVQQVRMHQRELLRPGEPGRMVAPGRAQS